MSTESLLEVRGLSVRYGATVVVRDVSLSVAEGEVVALVGANGAGKTTTLKAISGAMTPMAGEVRFRGERVRSSPYAALRAGIAHCPEGRLVFPHMTVRENLQVGAHTVRERALIEERRERMLDDFPVLRERADQRAGTMSGGEQQMLALARALMSGPDVLLIDEPTMGLAPIVVGAVGDILERLKAAGTSVLLVEETADLTLRVADRIHLMEGGRIVLSGTPEELAESDLMRRLYLGESPAAALPAYDPTEGQTT